jgi:hypothetical protein
VALRAFRYPGPRSQSRAANTFARADLACRWHWQPYEPTSSCKGPGPMRECGRGAVGLRLGFKFRAAAAGADRRVARVPHWQAPLRHWSSACTPCQPVCTASSTGTSTVTPPIHHPGRVQSSTKVSTEIQSDLAISVRLKFSVRLKLKPERTGYKPNPPVGFNRRCHSESDRTSGQTATSGGVTGKLKLPQPPRGAARAFRLSLPVPGFQLRAPLTRPAICRLLAPLEGASANL